MLKILHVGVAGFLLLLGLLFLEYRAALLILLFILAIVPRPCDKG